MINKSKKPSKAFTVRVISGQFKNRSLVSPRSLATHPMSERARQAIFNSLGQKIHDARVLDLYAGTGALGIEALSRGATSCTFVENHPAALETLHKNLHDLENARVYSSSVQQFLSVTNQKFDLIFLDPPYELFASADFVDFYSQFQLGKLLLPEGIIVLSRPRELTLSPRFFPGLKSVSLLQHAAATLEFFQSQLG